MKANYSGPDPKALNRAQDMQTPMSAYLGIFGIFLILVGVIGYTTHPDRSPTELIFSGGFGALWVLWGILNVKGVRWSGLAALTTTTLLLVATGWRASLSWIDVTSGQSDLIFASFLLTLVLGVSAFMLRSLLKDKNTFNLETPGRSSHNQHNTNQNR